MLLINKFDEDYDGTPLSIRRTVPIAINEDKVLYICKKLSLRDEDNGMVYSTIVFTDGTDIICKEDIEWFDGKTDCFVRFVDNKYNRYDVIVNKNGVKSVCMQCGLVYIMLDRFNVYVREKFEDVVERLKWQEKR